MVVRRRRRIYDHLRLQISTLATHTYDHPDVPTHQSVCWRIQLPTCQLGFQQNTPDGESLDSCATFNNLGLLYDPKETASFFLSPMARRHQPRSGLREFLRGQPTAEQTCSKKVPAATTPALFHNGSETQGSCPQGSGEALELP